jgi:ubiquinol-cytochrome c reductase cytochrome b subunit
MRGAIFVIPVIAFVVAKRWCISLQRADNDRLLHGYETGIIMRSPEGGYSERHLPISDQRAYTLTARKRDHVYTAVDGTDANGVNAPNARADRIRAKLSRAWYATNVQKPTAAELTEGHHHAEEELEYEHAAGLDLQADGHQYDGRHDVAGDDLTHKH